MNEKLKPCPLCASDVSVRRFDYHINEDLCEYWIKCKCGISTKPYESRAKLIAFWNTRKKTKAKIPKPVPVLKGDKGAML